MTNDTNEASREPEFLDAAQTIRVREIKPNKRDVNQRTSEYLQWQALKPAGDDND